MDKNSPIDLFLSPPTPVAYDLGLQAHLLLFLSEAEVGVEGKKIPGEILHTKEWATRKKFNFFEKNSPIDLFPSHPGPVDYDLCLPTHLLPSLSKAEVRDEGKKLAGEILQRKERAS